MMVGDDPRSRFEFLYDRHLAAVMAYAIRRAGREGAEEIVAETFLVAWRRLDEVPGEARPWLLAVARNVLGNRARSERRRLALLERLSAAPPAIDPGPQPVDPDLVIALRTLPEDERELLCLLAWDGLTRDEAAAALGVSRATLRVRLHRARRHLHREICVAGDQRALGTNRRTEPGGARL